MTVKPPVQYIKDLLHLVKQAILSSQFHLALVYYFTKKLLLCQLIAPNKNYY